MKKSETKKQSKKTVRKKRLVFKPNSLIIILVIALALIGLSYFLLGKILTVVLTVGITLILLIGRWLDKPKPKTKRRKIFKIACMVILGGGILVLLGGSAFMFYIVKNAPNFQAELLKKNEATIIYDSEGNEYAKLGSEHRENIEYDEANEVFIDALIATEDSRFFQHNGFDLMRFTKAAMGQVMGNSDAGGGSTLTMQVAKNTFTDAKEDRGIRGIIRKFTDIYISIFQLERNYTKEQIIEFYINNNTASSNWQIFGIQETSQYYFGKDAKDLNLAEASMLAGMYQAPSSYDPFKNPKNATKRRSTVLYLMQRHGYITKEERQLAESIPVTSLLTTEYKNTNPYQGYIDLVVREVKERWGVDPNKVPMLIYTNMVRNKQDGVNSVLNGTGGFKWKDAYIQSGISVVDSTSGKIMAIGAGRNRKTGDWNYAIDNSRHIGSTAKPLFDYAPGMEYNNWSTYTLFDDEKGYTYSNGKSINNFDGKWEGIITLRRALSNSRNIPALKAFQQVDNKKIVELVTSIGIKPELSNGFIHEAHAIGSFDGANPLIMSGAYQIFSNGGYYYQPYSVNKVTFRSNGETYEYASAKVKVISDSTAYMITDVLKGALKSTTTAGLNKDHFAIKTGTTNVDSATKKARGLPSSIVRDYWIDGWTHNTVISLWIGYDELDKKYYLNYDTDGNMRHKLLNAVAKKCFSHDNVDFTQPKSVVRIEVEKLSDPPMLPSDRTPKDQRVTELFKRGTEPTEISTKFLILDTPANFNVQYNRFSNSVTLSWNAVSDLGYVPGGKLGYYIYVNNEKLYFTEGTSYTINNYSDYIGTYSVRAGYYDTEKGMSNPSTYELKDIVTYKLNFNGNSTTTYKVNDTINNNLYNGNLVTLTADDVNVTSSAQMEITITDSKGNKVTIIDNTKANTYTITYKLTYKTYTGTCNNKIIIEERS